MAGVQEQTQLQGHLRKFVDDGIKRKVKLTETIEDYKKQEYKSRERVIDQTQLESILVTGQAAQDEIDLVIERKEKDREIMESCQNSIILMEDDIKISSKQMIGHLKHLSAIEIEAGGFVAHSVGLGKKATYDEENKSFELPEANTRAEIPIGTKLNDWKDSNQLTIKKSRKKAE